MLLESKNKNNFCIEFSDLNQISTKRIEDLRENLSGVLHLICPKFFDGDASAVFPGYNTFCEINCSYISNV